MSKENNIINVRLRLVIIQNNKIVVTYNTKKDYYYYIGGHLEFGESVLEACQREIHEECGEKYNFVLDKILYIRDWIVPEDNEHSLELFILGKLNSIEGLDGYVDPEHPDGSHVLKLLDMSSLPTNILPKILTERIIREFKEGFPVQGEYVGRI